MIQQQNERSENSDPFAQTSETEPSFSWKGLLLQSLAFNTIENGVRLAADPAMRDQIAHKPFWHDYSASLRQYHMNRWNDGDSFVVNDVGHPMQGAISEYIWIQNSPHDSRLRMGDPGYWKSRWRGMLWSTVYSTHSEIAPLGENGIGNQGGFTYGLPCMEHCVGKNAKGWDKFTNNTGWTDFIITPVVGQLWVLAEDLLDREVSDRVQGDDRTGLTPKILRGSLNPSRTFANLLRGKLPWYRDIDHPIARNYGAVRFIKSDEDIAWLRHKPRYEIAPHYNGFSIAVNTPNCNNCRRLTTGPGVELSARLTRWLDADADLSYHGNASPLPSDRAGGDMFTGVFGVRSGFDTPHYALKVSLRPGFVHFDHAYTSSPTNTIIYPDYPATTSSTQPPTTVVNAPPAVGDVTHFVWNANLTADYKLGRNLGFRMGLSEMLVRYRTDVVDPPGQGTLPYLSYLSKDYFLNRGNWTYQIGPVFSF